MINSKYRADILYFINAFGVIPADLQLLLMFSPTFESIDKLKKAVKKLKDAGYIRMICIENYPRDKNRKDAYVLSSKGKKTIPLIYEKFGYTYQRHPRIAERLKDRNFDLLNRLAMTELFFCSTKNNKYISKDDFIDYCFGDEITQEYKSLRFHGVFEMSNRYVPIYNTMYNNLSIDYNKEYKFFKNANEKHNNKFDSFDKIIFANDAEIIKKLIVNPINSNSKTVQNTKYKRVFHPYRYERERSILILKNQNSLVKYLPEYDFYESLVTSYCEAHAQDDGFVQIDRFDAYGDKYDTMLFLDLYRIKSLYLAVLETAKGRNNNKYRIYTYYTNVPVLDLLFEGYEEYIKIYYFNDKSLKNWKTEKESVA